MAVVMRDGVGASSADIIPREALLFPQPATFILSGKSGSGKTHFLLKFLQNHKRLGHVRSYTRVHVCFREEQNGIYEGIANYLSEPDSQVHLHPGSVPNDLYERLDPIHSNLVILDDLFLESFNSEAVQKLFISGRHRNTSVILCTQNVFPPGTRFARTISLNASYIILFKSRDLGQIRVISRQILGETRKGFLEAVFLDATKTRGGYVLLDLTSTQSVEEIRVRSNVLGPVEDVVIYQPS